MFFVFFEAVALIIVIQGEKLRLFNSNMEPLPRKHSSPGAFDVFYSAPEPGYVTRALNRLSGFKFELSSASFGNPSTGLDGVTEGG